MRFSRRMVGPASLLFLTAVAAACGSSKGKATGTLSGSSSTSTGTGFGGTTSSTSVSGSGSGGSGGGLVLNDGGDETVISVTISPATATMEVLNGTVPAAQSFTAMGLTKGGQMIPVTGEWSFDRLDVGAMNAATGALTATGLVGGVGTVTFSSNALSATASATVKLHYTSDPQTTPPAVMGAFGQATMADTAMAQLYPYDQTVFPRGLTGPVLQWNGGAATDVYYIHAVSPTFEFESWTTVPPPSQFSLPTMPDDIWTKLTDSTTGKISVSVQRYDGTQAYLAQTRTWIIAPANLTGTIYYWQVNSGAVVRIQPGPGQTAQTFLQEPAGVTCIACHSVSKDGSTLVAAFNGSASPWGTFDSSGNSLYVTGTDPSNGPAGSGFEAIAPDGSKVLFGQERADDTQPVNSLILSAKTDQTPLTLLTPTAGSPVYPAWSGDSASVAFAVRTDGNWLDFTQATLWTASVDLTTNMFTNVNQIVAATADRPAAIYPTFSPDSKWIAFERSTQARSRGAQGDVWLVGSDGSNPVSLDNANGLGILTGPEVSSTYEPTMMPVPAGGYFWLVVVSERTYGNTLTTTDPTTRNKQLWVSAIDATPMPGQDPSHPAFWLPGQDLTNNNMRGEWSLSPCMGIGSTCTAGFECCAGYCQKDGTGNLTCSNTSSGCSMLGDKCALASDCCDTTAACTGGFCAIPTPMTQ